MLSWEEIGVTLFITSVNAITLPRLMWMGLRDNIDPAIAAISVILIIITVLVLAIRSLVQWRRAEQHRAEKWESGFRIKLDAETRSSIGPKSGKAVFSINPMLKRKR